MVDKYLKVGLLGLSGVWVADVLYTCRPAGAWENWFINVLYTYRPSGPMLVH